MRRPEVERMRALLVEAITTLCRSGLQYSSNMKVEGLIGITLDEADIILVNLNKCYSTGLTEIEGGKPQKERSQQEQAANSDVSDCFETGSPTVQSPEPYSNRRKRKSEHYGGSSPPHPSKRLFEPSDASTPNKSSQRHRTPGDSGVSPPPRGHSSSTADTDEGTQENAPLSSTSLASPSSQTDSNKRTAAQSSHENQSKEPIVKIEIESDPEVEEVKSEPGQRDSCSLSGSSFYQTQLSNTTIVQTALPTYSTAYPIDTSQAGTSSDYHGELHISQLPAEFAAATQSDTAVPVGMFTSSLAAPMPGPSGLNIQPQGGAAFSQADQMATQAALLQANKSVENELLRDIVTSADLRSLGKDPSQFKLKPCENQASRKVYACKYCGKVFMSNSGWLSHEQSHEGKYKYKCTICGKGFSASTNLVGHMNNHENKKPYSCEICDKKFAYKHNRDRHQHLCKFNSTSSA